MLTADKVPVLDLLPSDTPGNDETPLKARSRVVAAVGDEKYEILPLRFGVTSVKRCRSLSMINPPMSRAPYTLSSSVSGFLRSGLYGSMSSA